MMVVMVLFGCGAETTNELEPPEPEEVSVEAPDDNLPIVEIEGDD